MDDAWPKEYADEPFRSYACILDEQPCPPRSVTFSEVLKAQFRSSTMYVVLGLGIVGSVFFPILVFAQHYDPIRTFAYSTVFGVVGLFLLSVPFIISQRMTRSLRYGVRAEAHLVRTKGTGQYYRARVKINLGRNVVEREAPAGLHYAWLENVTPGDVIEVLADPKSGVPRLFLKVKTRDRDVVGETISPNAGRYNQPHEVEETLPGEREGVLVGCTNCAVMLGVLISVLSIGLALLGLVIAFGSPTATEAGKQTVESLSLVLLLVGVGAFILLVLLLVLPVIIMAARARNKH